MEAVVGRRQTLAARAVVAVGRRRHLVEGEVGEGEGHCRTGEVERVVKSMAGEAVVEVVRCRRNHLHLGWAIL